MAPFPTEPPARVFVTGFPAMADVVSSLVPEEMSFGAVSPGTDDSLLTKLPLKSWLGLSIVELVT